MSNPILELNKVVKNYKTANGNIAVLAGVNLSINEGETVAIIGQSGSGKSTLLHIAGLLDSFEKGTVSIKGHPSRGMKDFKRSKIRNNTIGFVYQHHHLLREFTALENVLMPARIAGKSGIASKLRAKHLLNEVGLAKRIDHLPSQLSGGEKQRVAIARALMNKPDILLADEPTGNLDPDTAADVSKMFHKMVKEHKMAMLLVTHNEVLAGQCKKVYRMVHGSLVSV